MVSSLTEEREGKGWRRNSRAWHTERKLESKRFSVSLLPYGEQPCHSTAHTCSNGEAGTEEGWCYWKKRIFNYIKCSLGYSNKGKTMTLTRSLASWWILTSYLKKQVLRENINIRLWMSSTVQPVLRSQTQSGTSLGNFVLLGLCVNVYTTRVNPF